MRKLDSNERKLCKTIGKIFEQSIELSKFSSDMFIRRFIFNDVSKTYFDKTYLATSNTINEPIYELNKQYNNYGVKNTYSRNQMYWIGNIYGCISFLYNLPSKHVYKLLPGKDIIKYYNIYHTFGLEEAAIRIIDNINYKNNDYTTEGVKILKRLINKHDNSYNNCI